MTIQPDESSFNEMRDEMMGNIDFEPTDEQLARVFTDYPHVAFLAAEWGWGDTEAREQLASALEEISGVVCDDVTD